MDLLLTHKRKLRVWNDMMSLSVPGDHEREGGGTRGEVKIFSRESRYRLFRLLHQLKFEYISFVTLTYPNEFPTNPKVYKAHLKEYRRRFEAKWGKVPAVWRLEFQERGAPHFHFLYLDAPFIPIKEWCSLWSDVIHTQDENHRKIGVDLKMITNGDQERLVAFYVGKYVAKIDERSEHGNTENCGRRWGRWNIIEESPIEVEVTDREAKLICAYALADRRRGSPWEPIDPTICTIFGHRLGHSEFGTDILGLESSLRKSGRR